MAKVSKPVEKPASRAKKVLAKRVNVGPGKLGRDVKVPKPLKSIGGYFIGSWRELRQVKWPNRRASWSLTLAVIAFTIAMVVLILALDNGFEQLFKQVIIK